MTVDRIRQITIIWLTAIFLCMSLISAVHSVKHIHEIEQTHLDCSLCSYKHQTNKMLSTGTLNFAINIQYPCPVYFLPTIIFFQYESVFQSRAPPIN